MNYDKPHLRPQPVAAPSYVNARFLGSFKIKTVLRAEQNRLSVRLSRNVGK